jgi:hypothetical protein
MRTGEPCRWRPEADFERFQVCDLNRASADGLTYNPVSSTWLFTAECACALCEGWTCWLEAGRTPDSPSKRTSSRRVLVVVFVASVFVVLAAVGIEYASRRRVP